MKRFEREYQAGDAVATADVETEELRERLRLAEAQLVETRMRLLEVEAVLREERSARKKIGDALTARLVGAAHSEQRVEEGEVAALATKLEREQAANDELNRQLETAWRRNHALGAANRAKRRWGSFLRRS